MKHKSTLLPLVLAALVGAFAALRAANADGFARKSVPDIINGAGVQIGQKVETYGVVERIDQREPGKVGIYQLRGDEGGMLEVQTNEPLPVVTSRMEALRGVVTAKDGREVFLFETRTGDDAERERERLRLLELERTQKRDRILYLVAGVAALLVVVAGFMFARARQAVLPPPPLPPPPPADKTVVDDNEITIRRNDVTVRLGDNTIKFLPGHLAVRTGGQMGAKLPLCGGNRVTLGRQHAGGRGANFIGLEDPTKGLSRNQAVIGYDDKASAFYLENQRGANATTLDGRALGEGETVALKEGMIIGFMPDYQLEFCMGAHVPTSRG